MYYLIQIRRNVLFNTNQEKCMPYGKGTYGSKVGRPPKKKKPKKKPKK